MERPAFMIGGAALSALILGTSACGVANGRALRPSVERIGESKSQMAFFHLNQAIALIEARGTGRCPGGQEALQMHAGESARLLATGRSVELQSIMRRVVDLVDPKMIRRSERAYDLARELHTVGERAGLREDKRWRDQALKSCVAPEDTARKAPRPLPPLEPAAATPASPESAKPSAAGTSASRDPEDQHQPPTPPRPAPPGSLSGQRTAMP